MLDNQLAVRSWEEYSDLAIVPLLSLRIGGFGGFLKEINGWFLWENLEKAGQARVSSLPPQAYNTTIALAAFAIACHRQVSA